MSIFENLFGRKKSSPPPVPPKAPTPATQSARRPVADPAQDPNMVRVFDRYGREMFIAKEAWRTSVLPGNLQANWNHPEQLFALIVGAVNDGFVADVLAAAEQLHRIDPVPTRAACIYGIVLMKNNHLDEAEQVLRACLQKHGEEGSVLTNLAKVYAARNEQARAEETLWRGLELDPNQDNGLGWYFARHRERGGEAAGKAALLRIAVLPGSWRAQLWLAREVLQARHLEEALALYQQSMAHAPKPMPADLLMQMSGDLGNRGHLPELLNLTEPHFDPQAHGLPVGNNLIKAHLDLGQLEAARRILDQLYALQRMDWREHLSFWDTEIAKARVATASVDPQAPLKITMLTLEGPVWLKAASPAAELFPAKPSNAPVVAFLGASITRATNSKRVEHQLADAPGRMSRAVPLFLAEQVEFGCQARVLTLVPWIVEPSAGFALSGGAWRDEDAAHHARQGQAKADYVVITHVNTTAEPWTVDLRLVRTIDAHCLGHLSTSFPWAKPEEGLLELASQMLRLLAEQAEVEAQPPPALYERPPAADFSNYLLRLEQLLAVRCSAMEGGNPGFLNGEREILEGNLQLCLVCPKNVTTRILLAQTLAVMKKVRPDILPEFKAKVGLLQKEQPLAEPAGGVLQRMFHEVFAVA